MLLQFFEHDAYFSDLDDQRFHKLFQLSSALVLFPPHFQFITEQFLSFLTCSWASFHRCTCEHHMLLSDFKFMTFFSSGHNNRNSRSSREQLTQDLLQEVGNQKLPPAQESALRGQSKQALGFCRGSRECLGGSLCPSGPEVCCQGTVFHSLDVGGS